ncbi:hypothetical protein P7C73_g5922, partial [Tremellales sp. Uapishka_1]
MLALTLLLPLLGLVSAAPALNKRYNVEIISQCTNSGQVALTFDDGPYIYEANVTADLNGGKGTFFLNGNNYVCIYDKWQEIQALHAAGHTIGSHTWTHADLTTLSIDGINSELEQVEVAFQKILGLKPLYFRPPYGNLNDNVLSVLDQRGYKSKIPSRSPWGEPDQSMLTEAFLWSDDTEDADGATVSYSENILDGVIKDYPNPHLVLDHSTIETTSTTVLPYAVPKLQAAGYDLVAVDTCLGSNGEYPYVYLSEPGTPDDTWTCS